jgi:hypothetical protein
MLSLRAHIIICASLFAAMLIIGWGGSILQATGVIGAPGILRIPLMILMFALFAGFGFSAIPVMVMLVLSFQTKIGNSDVPAVAAALRAQKTIIWVLWGLMLAGIAIGLPAAIEGGLFDPPAATQQ